MNYNIKKLLLEIVKKSINIRKSMYFASFYSSIPYVCGIFSGMLCNGTFLEPKKQSINQAELTTTFSPTHPPTKIIAYFTKLDET